MGHLFWAESWGNRQGADRLPDNVLSPLSSVCKELQKPEEGATESAGRQGRLPEDAFWTDSGDVGVSEGASASNLQILNQKQTQKSEREIKYLPYYRWNWKQLRFEAQRVSLLLILSDFKLNAIRKHRGCRQQNETLKKHQCKTLLWTGQSFIRVGSGERGWKFALHSVDQKKLWIWARRSYTREKPSCLAHGLHALVQGALLAWEPCLNPFSNTMSLTCSSSNNFLFHHFLFLVLFLESQRDWREEGWEATLQRLCLNLN